MKKANKIDALKKLKAFVKSDEFGRDCISQYQGLCAMNYALSQRGVISYNQYVFIREIIRRKDIEVNIPRDRGHYLWLRGTKSPRIKFINEHLKRLEKKWYHI